MGKRGDESFVGTIVLIEPLGDLGHVVSVSSGKDMVEIAFYDGNMGRYSPHDLLVLHSSEIILKGLLRDWKISNQDCRAVLQVIRLLSIGNNEDAMRCAMTNETTKAFCIIRVSSYLSLTQENGTRIKKNRGLN